MCDQTFAAQFGEDDDLGGGLCHLWSSDHALLVVEIITIIIMRVTRMMWKRSLSSCSFRPQAKLRKMTQLQRKKNPIKTKHKEDEAAWHWTFFPCILLTCVSTPNGTKWFGTIFESHQSFLSTSLLPVCWLFDGSLSTAFCFYFSFWFRKIRLRCDVAVLHLEIFWPIFHFEGCVFSCPGQPNRWPCHSLTDWVSSASSEHYIGTNKRQILDTFDTTLEKMETTLGQLWDHYETNLR